jgi:very-short-patch-repair endonuclease
VRQAGLIRTAQLTSSGCSPATIRSLVRSGRIASVRRGVYRMVGPAASPLHPGAAGPAAELWLAVLVAGPAAMVWRRSAAWWWGLDGVDIGAPEITGRPDRSRGLPVTRVTSLGPADRTVHRGLPVTSAGRTLVDLGTALGADEVERALESALRSRLVSVADMEGRCRGPVRGGALVLREVLRRRPGAAPPTESDAETRFIQLVRRAGFPAPVRQMAVMCHGRRFRLDAAWPAERLAVEIDGAATHANAEALGRDLRRQNALVLEGWTVLRFTWEDVVRYPDQVVEALDGQW